MAAPPRPARIGPASSAITARPAIVRKALRCQAMLRPVTARPVAAAQPRGPLSPWPPSGSGGMIALATVGQRRKNRPMRLRWNAEPGLDVTDAAQLDRALDALLAGPAADRPLIAYLAGDAGALGLGLDPAEGGVLLVRSRRPRPARPARHWREAWHGRRRGVRGQRAALPVLRPLPD